MSDQKGLIFPAIVPWSELVDLAELLDEISGEISRYSILSEEANKAVTLWIAGTYIFDHLSLYPLLLLTSPEKRCGKTTLLLVIKFMVHSPFTVSNISPASLFRMIERHAPTLLIDEADTFLADKAEMTGIINSGHTKSAARVVRCAPNTHEPESFSTWCPKVIAMIKKPAETLVDRSIVIQLKRKLPTEKTDRLRHSDGQKFEVICRKLARIAIDYNVQIAEARPSLPDCLNDRASENWEPLIAIADIAGDSWGRRARDSAITLSLAIDNDEENLGILLLRDIAEIFETESMKRISSDELCSHLIGTEESPWGDEYLTKRKLAKLLSPFGIRPSTHRINNKPQKGYLLSDFADAFPRYLGKTVTPLQPNTEAISNNIDEQ